MTDPQAPGDDTAERVTMPLLALITTAGARRGLRPRRRAAASPRAPAAPAEARLGGLAAVTVVAVFGVLIAPAAVQTSRRRRRPGASRDALINRVESAAGGGRACRSGSRRCAATDDGSQPTVDGSAPRAVDGELRGSRSARLRRRSAARAADHRRRQPGASPTAVRANDLRSWSTACGGPAPRRSRSTAAAHRPLRDPERSSAIQVNPRPLRRRTSSRRSATRDTLGALARVQQRSRGSAIWPTVRFRGRPAEWTSLDLPGAATRSCGCRRADGERKPRRRGPP